MVRVWIRPALAALSRQAAKNVAARAGVQQALFAQQHVVAVRAFSSKKEKGFEKKSIHDKFVEDDDLTEVPPEVEYLAKENLDPELLRALVEADLEVAESDSDSDEDVDENSDGEDELAQLEKLLEESEDGDEVDEDEDDEDAGLTDAEWAAKYERELAEVEAGVEQEVEDDRLYIEMPNYDTSLSMASEGDMDDDDDESADPFAQWEQGAAYSPEMLNWMLPREKRQPFTTKKEKPWKYFVRANHPDPVELAMDVDLLRLFISPTGRIRPRRFTGLTAKQQRQLARAVKISRQLALLPYLSRYPEPSPEQWRAMEEEEIAKLTALAELDDGSVDDDDDDDDDFEDLDEE